MENKTEPSKKYELWHLAVAFAVGVALVASIIVVPSFGLQGKAKLNPFGDQCTVTTCDISKKLDELLKLFKHYSGALDSFTVFTGQWTAFTGQWTSFTEGVNSFLLEGDPQCREVCDERLGYCKIQCEQ
ncbi:MAG: hypothetical protein AAB427_06065 [Chloroflexota bacterium]